MKLCITGKWHFWSRDPFISNPTPRPHNHIAEMHSAFGLLECWRLRDEFWWPHNVAKNDDEADAKISEALGILKIGRLHTTNKIEKTVLNSEVLLVFLKLADYSNASFFERSSQAVSFEASKFHKSHNEI